MTKVPTQSLWIIINCLDIDGSIEGGVGLIIISEGGTGTGIGWSVIIGVGDMGAGVGDMGAGVGDIGTTVGDIVTGVEDIGTGVGTGVGISEVCRYLALTQDSKMKIYDK